jgi:hypothetical protein
LKKSFVLLAILVTIVLSGSFYVQRPALEEVPYPAGYRNWTHIKTMITGSGTPTHTGFHHIYANDKAIAGYKTGVFGDGSVIVFDVLESVSQANADVVEGKRKLIDVMLKDSVKYKATGGWGFEEFPQNSQTERKIRGLAEKVCFSCHSSKKETGFVFSLYRE